MAKALDEILQKYFGCSVPFRKDGELTTTGEKAMRKLEELLSDLEGIGVIPSASTAVRILDEITHEGQDENDNPVLREAIKYVRENMDDCDLAILKAKVDKNFTQHMNPAYGIDDGKIIDLLEEYGQDNDLPEGWWEELGDIDDWMVKL